MSSESRQHWAEVERWLDLALSQPQAERSDWLTRQPISHALRQEVQELLDAERASRGWAEASGATQALTEGEQVGAWQVKALIGHGASGEVYRVLRTDGSYEQVAALKLLRHADDPEEWRRFSSERRLLARLQDPAIAHLIDGGSYKGRLYAVLEYVDGVPFDQAAATLTLPARVNLFVQVARAVSVAHAQGIVHRDLKPSNVLVDRQGRVRLLDFGIAKLVQAEVAQTSDLQPTAALRLTPDFCAPEQLQGRPIGPAADVFALGVMLHQVLVGSLPWSLQGNGLQRAVQRLHSDLSPGAPSAKAPKAARRALQGDLDAIMLRCLRADPADRYSDASALRDELLRWQQGRPVLARGESAGYVLSRLVRRHRLAVGAGVALLASLAVGLAGVAWQAREAARERDIARSEAASNKSVRDYLLTMFRVAGEQSAGTGEPTARKMLAQAAERLGRDLDKDPAAAAETLLALAQLYFQLNDYVGAVPLFERLLDRSAALKPDVLAQVHHDLALCLWRTGQAARAAPLLALAQAHWQSQGPVARNRMLESRLLEAQLLRARGQVPESVALLEAALPERLALSGERHVDTATLLNNLATARFHAGQLPAARQDFERAWAIWQALNAQHSADGLNTLNNWAALALREGRADEAERLFQQALDLRRAHLPPSAAQAALQNNLGKMVLRRGAAAQALPMLREAVAMGEQYAGPASQHTLSALAGVAEAQIALREFDAAKLTLGELQQRAERQWGPDHLLSGVGHLTQARWHAAQEQWLLAEQRLARAEAIWTAVGAPAAPYLSQAQALRKSWPSFR
ncbi:MAG: protein kinase domain-containing protein [Rubrivivax sp.]|nr:serine/threonine-protein kinase [Rubrivivax sp.]